MSANHELSTEIPNETDNESSVHLAICHQRDGMYNQSPGMRRVVDGRCFASESSEVRHGVKRPVAFHRVSAEKLIFGAAGLGDKDVFLVVMPS